jgi:hypothetical protein
VTWVSGAWVWLTEHATVLSAAISAIATIFIARYTLTLRRSTDKLWEAGEHQIKVAQKAADAAELAAQATRDSVVLAEKTAANNEELRKLSERARVSGGGIRAVVSMTNITGGTGLVLTNEFEIHINNHGRGPAALRRIRWGFCTTDRSKMPPEPPYDAGNISFEDSIAPGAQSKLTKIVKIPNPTTMQAIVVRFDYYDVFLQQDDWAGFILEIIPGERLPIPIEAPEGYTRQT